MSDFEKRKKNSPEAILYRKNKMWEMRLIFTNMGQRNLQARRHADAAINYEKYIRTLELIFEAASGELNPEHFRESARTAEISNLAGVYWDLVRIYDKNPKYKDRQEKCALQLSIFAPLTPHHEKWIKQAEIFVKHARQPEIIKMFLDGKTKPSRCFIATAAFSSPNDQHVIFLRDYRDHVLKKTSLGRKFIYFYYKNSPPIAEFLDNNPSFKSPTRWALQLLIKCVSSI